MEAGILPLNYSRALSNQLFNSFYRISRFLSSLYNLCVSVCFRSKTVYMAQSWNVAASGVRDRLYTLPIHDLHLTRKTKCRALSMLKRARDLAASGVQIVALPALDDDGAPAYNHDVTAAIASFGVPSRYVTAWPSTYHTPRTPRMEREVLNVLSSIRSPTPEQSFRRRFLGGAAVIGGAANQRPCKLRDTACPFPNSFIS